RQMQWPIVKKMFDANVELAKGRRKEGATEWLYIDAAKPEERELIAGEPIAITAVQNNVLGSYRGEVARNLELARGLADTRMELAGMYSISPAVLRDDPLRGKNPDAYQWTLRGDVDGAMRESVNRVIRDVRKKKGNTLILVLNCGGTDLDTARG